MMLVGGARDGAAARRARHDAPAADGRAGRDHARGGAPRRSPSSRASCARKFGIAAPRIAVCGLNPHAGEGGHLGREEIDVIAPAIADARARRASTSPGRCPPTPCSCRSTRARYDAIVAMYHDQGLPVLKAASFGRGVNVTLGLPFVRTSVDHGTALDLARDAGARARPPIRAASIAAVDLAIDASAASAAHAGASRPTRQPPCTDHHAARKRFGQNFLVDPHYVARIVDAIAPQRRRQPRRDRARARRADRRR